MFGESPTTPTSVIQTSPMTISTPSPDYIAFEDQHRLALGTLHEVALAVKAASEARPLARILVFHARSSELIDFDCRGTPQEMLQRLAATPAGQAALASATPQDTNPAVTPATQEPPVASAGPGRPRLGVVAREVTLLPRHWEWLSSQPGGASVALRKLVDQAKKSSQHQDNVRLAQEASYRFMSAMAGSLADFEEAARALFAADQTRFEDLIAPWPPELITHLRHLAQPALSAPVSPDTPHA